MVRPRPTVVASVDNDKIVIEQIEWQGESYINPLQQSPNPPPASVRFLVFSRRNERVQSEFDVRLRQIAERENFQIIPQSSENRPELDFCEDYCIVGPDDTAIVPFLTDPGDFTSAIDESRKARLSKLGLDSAPKCLLNAGGKVATNPDGVETLKPYLGNQFRQSKLYIEGGNI